MDIQYITDVSGQKSGVILPFNQWQHIQRELDELEKLRNKLAFIEGLKEAFNEVEQIKKGEKQSNSLQVLFNELHNSTD